MAVRPHPIRPKTGRSSRSGIRLRIGVVALASWVVVGLTPPAMADSGDLSVTEAKRVFELRSGVIVDAGEQAAFLMTPRGRIDAIDLSTGRRLWTADDAAKPLLLHGRRLVAQAGPEPAGRRLRIVVLDTRNAGEVMLEAGVPMPEGVRVSIDDGLGERFTTKARVHDGAIIVSWRYAKQRIEGTPTPPDDAMRVVSGAARIGLEEGDVEILALDQVPPPPELRLPEDVARAVEPAARSGPVWRLDDILATVDRTAGNGQQRTVLRRWRGNDGRALPDVVLSTGDFTFRGVSADGRHALVGRRDETGNGWLWRVFSLATGKRVAELRSGISGAPFFVTASSLVHEAQPTGRSAGGELVIDEPLRLRAVSLANGGELWQWPIRDTAYRGPYPPGTGSPGAPGQPAAPPGPRQPGG